MKNVVFNNLEAAVAFNLSIREDILDICKPLYDNFGITYFEYDRIYNNGKAIYISTNKDWLKFSIEHQMFDDVEHVRLCSIAKNNKYRYALWDPLKLGETQLLSKYREYDIWNGLTINEVEEETFTAYSFATTPDNTGLNNFYINNLKLFDHFVLHIKQQINLIIEKKLQAVLLPATPLENNTEATNDINYLQNIENFLDQTKIKRFYIKLNGKDIYITHKELQCLSLLSYGKTMKGIGIKLNISPRTVEDHLNSIKLKTGTSYKNQLISLFENYGLPMLKGDTH